MKCVARFLPSILVPVLLLLLSGCGNSVGTSSTDTPLITPAVAVSITEDSVTLAGGDAHQFTANVAGLTANHAVTWGLAGCSANCGTISSTGFYTAPSSVSSSVDLQVVAASQVDPGKTDTAKVYLKPVAVSIAPGDVWMLPGETRQFTSSVFYDINKRGVTWNLTCSNGDCGTLHNAAADSVTYAAPAAFPDPPIVTLTAASGTDPNKTSQVSIAESTSDTLAAGNYAFLYSGWELEFTGDYYWPFRFSAAGHFRADGKGNIVDGVEDITSIHGVVQSVPFTGSYGVGEDRRGFLNIIRANETATYRLVLEPSGTKARFIRYEEWGDGPPVSGGGYLQLQDRASFSLSTFDGGYAMGLSGAGTGHNWSRVTAAARFTIGPDGILDQGRMDLTKQGHSETAPAQFANLHLTGSLSVPAVDTGRGNVSITIQGQDQAPENLNFVYYIVSGDKLFLVQTDPRVDESTGSVLSGEARRQSGVFSTESLKGPVIFSMAGLNRDGYGAYFEHVLAGQLVADGLGSFTGGIDDNGYPYSPLVNQAFHGSYTMDSGGRSELKLGTGNIDEAVAYFYGPNQAFIMQPTGTSDLLFGDIRPQAPGPFDTSSIAGTFLTVTASPTSEESVGECGLTTFDGKGGAIASIDSNEIMNSEPDRWREHFELAGTYDVAPNGRGTLTFQSQERTIVFWLVSPTEMVGNAAMSSGGFYYIDWSALLEFTR